MKSRARRRPRMGTAIALALSLAASSGCGSSQLLNAWRDPNYSAPPMHNVFVLVARRDPARRRLWETAFVDQLKKKGAQATPSYVYFADDIPDTQAVRDKVREGGYDGVLVCHEADKEERSHYVPGYTSTVPVTVFQPYWGVYSTVYETVHHPGYVETETAVQIQTDVWTTGSGGKLVWSAVSETVDPSNATSFSREVSDLVVDELAKMRLIPKG